MLHKPKRNYYLSLYYFRTNPCNETKPNVVKARSEYKKTVGKTLYSTKNETKILEAARLSNAKEDWKMLKNNAHKTETSPLVQMIFLFLFKQ